MQDNVNIALQNCVHLDSIEKQTEELQLMAGDFKKKTKKLKDKMWWKNMQIKLFFLTIVLIIILIIIVVAVTSSQTKN